jgi:hypothetical protein
MSATSVTAVALGAAVVGRWANNKSALTVKSSVGAVVALVAVSALDHGKTAPVAQGLAWVILAAVLLSKNSPVAGIAKTVNSYNPPKAKPKTTKKKAK